MKEKEIYTSKFWGKILHWDRKSYKTYMFYVVWIRIVLIELLFHSIFVNFLSHFQDQCGTNTCWMTTQTLIGSIIIVSKVIILHQAHILITPLVPNLTMPFSTHLPPTWAQFMMIWGTMILTLVESKCYPRSHLKNHITRPNIMARLTLTGKSICK